MDHDALILMSTPHGRLVASAVAGLATLLTIGACDRGLPIVDPCVGVRRGSVGTLIESSIDTSGWIRVSAADSLTSYLLPSSFRRDTGAQFAARGTRWRDGDRTLDEVIGDWSESGFRPSVDRSSTLFAKCRVRLAGRVVLVTSTLDADEYAVAVWFMPDSGDSAPSLALEGRGLDRHDQDVFLTSFRSVRLR